MKTGNNRNQFQSAYHNYNKSKVILFLKFDSDKIFLSPINLYHRYDVDFEKNEERLENETQFFEALHYVKYKLHISYSQENKLLINKYFYLWKIIRNRIINANLGLVWKCIQTTSIIQSKDILLSEGYFALLRAVDAFDPWRLNKFSTYAYTSVSRSFIKAMDVSKLGIHKEIDPEDAETNNDKHSDQNDLYIERLRHLLASNNILTEQEQLVIKDRFAFNDENSVKTLEEIGNKISLSKERVRQIQNSAIRKIKEAFDQDKILK